MEALPMLNQPAAVKKPPPVKKSAGREDRFAPELHKARNQKKDDTELAGAAVVQSDSRQEQQSQTTDNSGDTADSCVEAEEVSRKNCAEQKQQVAQESQPAENKQVSVSRGVDAAALIDAVAGSESQQEAVSVAITDGVKTVMQAVENDSSAVEAGLLAEETRPSAIKQAVAQPVTAVKQAVAENLAVEIKSGPETEQVAKTKPVAETKSVADVAINAAKVAVDTAVHATVVKQNPATEEVVAVLPFKSDEIKVVDKGSVTDDPLFATLLNKPEIAATLRQRQDANVSVTDSRAAVVVEPSAGEEVLFNADAASGAAVDSVIASVDGQSRSMENAQFSINDGGEGKGSALHDHGTNLNLHQQVQINGKSDAVVHFKNNVAVSESHVVQQTINHLTIHARGDSSSVTVKLHPEELGELQLRMVMEGDQLKVHLHAQSQQVQEVLERHFPKLRDALQDQGVTVEQFQVSVDSGDRGAGQFSGQQEFAESAAFSGFTDTDSEGENSAALMSAAGWNGGGSLSVRI